MRRKQRLGFTLLLILLAWIGTARYGIPHVVRWVEADQTQTHASPGASSAKTYSCYVNGKAVAPFIVFVSEGCSEDLEAGEMGSGYTQGHVHCWFLFGQRRMVTLWLTEDELMGAAESQEMTRGSVAGSRSANRGL